MVNVFYNAGSGPASKGDASQALAAKFAAAGVEARLIAVESPEQTRRAVRAAIAEGAAAVVAAGGDGTVSSVAAGLIGSDTPLGVMPLGTLNHFARDVGIPTDEDEAVRTIAAGTVRQVDVATLNERPFLNNSSLGVYPDIVVEREALRGRGYRKWPALVVATARIVWRYRGVVVRVSAGAAVDVLRTPFLFVGNNEYEVEGLKIGRRATIDGGRLAVYFAPRLHGRDLPKLAAMALSGRIKANPALGSFTCTALDVDTPGRRRMRVALDGEVTVLTTPLRYRIVPRALGVLVPAAGSAAAAPTR